jgi:hypothetical protein
MNTSNPYILPTAYFGPIQYFCRIASPNPIIIEQYDHYSKQTYRNRCEIMGANGKIVLSIPVKRQHGRKNYVKDICIDYDTDWQKDHKRGIISSYKSSPYFEFYFDEYEWIYTQKTKFLIDLNQRILEIVISQLQIAKELILSDGYHSYDAESDLRDLISPKVDISEDKHFKPVEYIQVFIVEQGFVPNLSILDLLLNKGPEAINTLKNSFQ